MKISQTMLGLIWLILMVGCITSCRSILTLGKAFSDDLDADLKLMWETEAATDATGQVYAYATEEAGHAAIRVFNTIDLRGKSKEEVIAVIGAPQDEEFHANSGWGTYPHPTDAFVYLFCCCVCVGYGNI